jgi:hypothetical protein
MKLVGGFSPKDAFNSDFAPMVKYKQELAAAIRGIHDDLKL